MRIEYLCPNCKNILDFEYQVYYENDIDSWFKCYNCGWKTNTFHINTKEDIAKELRLKPIYVYKLCELVESEEDLEGIYFKRTKGKYRYTIDDSGDILVEDENGNLHYARFNIDDLISEDWIVPSFEVKWYKVRNFKETYPNGVLCWVYDEPEKKYVKIVVDYNGKFLANDWTTWKYASPIEQEYVPLILTKEKEKDETR